MVLEFKGNQFSTEKSTNATTFLAISNSIRFGTLTELALPMRIRVGTNR
jgi:hypothetical protein